MLIKEQFKILSKSKIRAGEALKEGLYPFFTSSDSRIKRINEYIYDDELMNLGTGGVLSRNYYNGKFTVSTDNFVLKSFGSIMPKFLYYFLRYDNLSVLKKEYKGVGLQHISKPYVENINIPVFSQEKQEEVIKNLDYINYSLENCKKHLSFLNQLINSRFIGQEVAA